jgi:hypothetical protein
MDTYRRKQDGSLVRAERFKGQLLTPVAPGPHGVCDVRRPHIHLVGTTMHSIVDQGDWLVFDPRKPSAEIVSDEVFRVAFAFVPNDSADPALLEVATAAREIRDHIEGLNLLLNTTGPDERRAETRASIHRLRVAIAKVAGHVLPSAPDSAPSVSAPNDQPIDAEFQLEFELNGTVDGLRGRGGYVELTSNLIINDENGTTEGEVTLSLPPEIGRQLKIDDRLSVTVTVEHKED